MYITNDDFERIEFSVNLLAFEAEHGHIKYHEGTKKRIQEAVDTLEALKAKKAKNNKRQNEYIKHKRKTDPKYFRSLKDWERYEANVKESE